MAENCKVYTPDIYAERLLDYVDYKKNLYGLKVLENSCGTGNILKCIVKRYIEDSLELGYSSDDISSGLEHYITGIDVDSGAIEECRKVLSNIASSYGIPKVKWNLLCEDALNHNRTDYDFVIGNPPYITYHDLSKEKRKELHDAFVTCKEGRFDYCYAFIEKSLCNLKSEGKIAYILPNSVLKNRGGKELRRLIKPYITKIIDLKNEDIFENVTLSPVILIMKKVASLPDDSVTFECIHKKMQSTILRTSLNDTGWALGDYRRNKKNRFGDYFTVGNSVATLCNEAFLIQTYDLIDENYIGTNGKRIERASLRPAVSIRTANKFPEPMIIFPYYYDENGLVKYTEEEFSRLFPCTVNYLQQYANKLSARDADKIAKWFEYGRAQALQHLNSEKLVISTVISGNVRLVQARREAIPYAGLYITRTNNLSLEKAAEILKQDDFLKYIEQYGVPTATNSYRVTKQLIEDYYFDF